MPRFESMIDGGYFLNGMAIGLSIAAPVGPIGVLCIRRSIAHGTLNGLSSGLGAATADAAYGSVAAFGLTAVSGFLVRQQLVLGLVGGGFLCYLGIRTFLSRPGRDTAASARSGIASAYGSTLLLTLANPATILSFVAVFAGLGLGRAVDYGSACCVVLGVFLGSASWWIILSTGVGIMRSRMKDGWMRAINRVSGAILFAFGIYAFCMI
jgi:threonine/homoserine/homoserine lactone efflux protein